MNLKLDYNFDKIRFIGMNSLLFDREILLFKIFDAEPTITSMCGQIR